MGITDVAGIIADSIRGDEEAGEPSNPNDGVAGDQGPVKNQPPDRRATASAFAISGSSSRMSGPWSRPVSARRRDRKRVVEGKGVSGRGGLGGRRINKKQKNETT